MTKNSPDTNTGSPLSHPEPQFAQQPIRCQCLWEGFRYDLVHESDWEYSHPANRELSFEDKTRGAGHWTKFEKCPKCSRCIFADGKPIRNTWYVDTRKEVA